MKLNAAKKRLLQRAAVALGVYYVAFFGAFFWLHRAHREVAVVWALAVLPTLPMVGVILTLGRYVKEETDEFHRDTVIRCMLWGTALVMSLVAYHSFLWLFGWRGNWPPMVEICGFLIGMGAAKLTYKVVNTVPADA